MKEIIEKPKYKLGKKIESPLGFIGTVGYSYFNEISKEWVYQMINGKKTIGMFKESNLK